MNQTLARKLSLSFCRVVAVKCSLLALFAIASTHSTQAQTSVSTLCPVQADISNLRSVIYKNSAPLRSGGANSPIVGFRGEPTLIMIANVSTRRTATIFDSNGKRLGSCPWASAHGTRGGRMRCTMKTAALRRAALRNTKSPSIIFKITPTRCITIPDAGKCYGSVKGLCTRTIK